MSFNTPSRGSVVRVARHWRDQPFYIPKQLQWQFLESPGEDKFVMQLGAVHIKDRCPLMIPNLMVSLSLHSMPTTSRSHGLRIDYHNFLCFLVNEKCILGCQFISKSLLSTQYGCHRGSPFWLHREIGRFMVISSPGPKLVLVERCEQSWYF